MASYSCQGGFEISQTESALVQILNAIDVVVKEVSPSHLLSPAIAVVIFCLLCCLLREAWMCSGQFIYQWAKRTWKEILGPYITFCNKQIKDAESGAQPKGKNLRTEWQVGRMEGHQVIPWARDWKLRVLWDDILGRRNRKVSTYQLSTSCFEQEREMAIMRKRWNVWKICHSGLLKMVLSFQIANLVTTFN